MYPSICVELSFSYSLPCSVSRRSEQCYPHKKNCDNDNNKSLPPFVLNSSNVGIGYLLSGGDHNLCWKDLSEEVIRELERRLEDDQTALIQICESFGMDILLFYSPTRKFREIFRMFPDTPVKLLKEVFEALQLYDLIDLLEEGKPRATRSLRPALRLQEMKKLRNPDDRPISYHSSAAVLIIDGFETCDTEGIEKFFKGFNTKSEVTVVRCRNSLEEIFRPTEWEHFLPRFPGLWNKNIEREMKKMQSTSLEVIKSWFSSQGW